MKVLRIRLNSVQLDRLSEILGNLGLVFFASLVIPVIQGSYIVYLGTVVSGIISASGCVIGSLILLRGGDA